MEFGLQIGGGSYVENLEWARWAESAGLTGYGVPDHYIRGQDDTSQPALDALALVAGLARETSSIELVLLVSPLTWRHPAVLAKTYATISEMSGGRFTLGVGTGWLEREHELFGLPFPPLSERFEMLEEALQYLRAAFADPPESFEGTHYRFEAFDMQPRPPLKLLVGGTGSVRTPTLAGRYADELNAYPAPEEDYAAKVEVARQAAIDADRDPDALLISSSGVVVAGDTEDEFRARLAHVAEVLGASPDDLEESFRVRNTPRGTWDQVKSVLTGLERAGMRRFWIQSLSQFQDEPADIERILDRLRD